MGTCQSLTHLPSGQNGRRFADHWKCIFTNDFFFISIKTALKFVPKGPSETSIGLDNGLAPNRRQIIIWTNADPIPWCIYAALAVAPFTNMD